MPHIIVRFPKGHESGIKTPGWHLLAKGMFDGEYTACGLATTEYETIKKKVDNGNITCQECLSVIKYCKSIKL